MMYKFTIPPVNGTNTTQSLINIVKEERVVIISFLYSELKNSVRTIVRGSRLNFTTAFNG